MSTAGESRNCGHPACGCKARNAEGYCSEYCKNAGDADTCGCGHADCGFELEKHPESLQVEETPFTKFFA